MPRRERTMAIATEEVEAPAENGTGRKRVDISALASENPNAKVTLSFQVPAGMRLDLKQRADAANVSEAQFVRDMVAGQISYLIPDEFNERKSRNGEYAGLSKEEKSAKQKEENQTKRETVNALLLSIANGALTPEQLDALGIDPTKLPKPRKEKEGAAA